MKSKKDIIKGVVKHTSVTPKSNFTDPNDPWSAKSNVAENITSKRSNLLKQFYKSKGWNVNYISKNKKVSQAKTGEYEKWKRDHGFFEENQIDEVSNELLGRYKSAAGKQASELDKAGGRENIQKANKRFSGIVKATKKQFANDDKQQGVAEGNIVKSIKRGLQGWGGVQDKPSEIVKRNKGYDTDTATMLRKGLDDSPEHSPAGLQKRVLDRKLKGVTEDVGDPKAATQSPADGANGGEERSPTTKSIKKTVKEIYIHSRKISEDLYDWEKDDKGGKPYGKKPTTQKMDGVNNIGDDKPNARLILKGGKTLTGEPRDTVEIDPMLKNRSKMPDYKNMDKINQKP